MSIAACGQLVEALPVLALVKRDVRSSISEHLLPALPALSVLDAGTPLRTTELAERLAVDNSVASRQVAALVAAGLVERLPDPIDHRAHRLRLTDAGHRRLAEIRRSVAERLAARLDGWSERDLLALVDLLERLGTTVKGCAREPAVSDRSDLPDVPGRPPAEVSAAPPDG